VIERLIPRFEPTISLGHILSAITFASIAVGAWYEVKTEQSLERYRLQTVEESVKTLTSVVHTLSEKTIIDVTQTAKIDGLDQRIRDIVEYARDTRARLHTVEDALHIAPPKRP